MTYLDHISKNYPVRRSTGQKKAFQNYVLEHIDTAKIEKTVDGKNENIIIGTPLTAKLVCTAHYDTPASSLCPNIMIPRNLLLFWLYQLIPVFLLLGVSLGAGFGLGAALSLPREQILLIFLILYYGLYFLLFRAKKNPNNYNDNTSGVAVILSMIDKLEPEQLKDVAFILFDNEEKGKKGSKAYFADHKDVMENKLLINFDCVGNGENILFIAMERAEKRAEYSALSQSFGSNGAFKCHFYPKKGSESNSDYKNFPCGIGCMACKMSKGGVFYTPYIHTPHDTVASNENIEFIAEGMKSFCETL